MNGTISEWLKKAEGDYLTAGREFSVATDQNFDAVCFHSQQAIEKMMKAAIIQAGGLAPKIHDLVELNTRLKAVRADWDWQVQELRLLSRAAVDFRYPGESADANIAKLAYQIAGKIRKGLLKLFPDSANPV